MSREIASLFSAKWNMYLLLVGGGGQSIVLENESKVLMYKQSLATRKNLRIDDMTR